MTVQKDAKIAKGDSPAEGKNIEINRADSTVYTAIAAILDSTPRKVSLVANLVRGRNAIKAINCLMFIKKKAAIKIRKLILSAMANAEYNHNADIDNLVIKDIEVGKSITLKRWMPRAKGRGAHILKHRSRVRVKLVNNN